MKIDIDIEKIENSIINELKEDKNIYDYTIEEAGRVIAEKTINMLLEDKTFKKRIETETIKYFFEVMDRYFEMEIKCFVKKVFQKELEKLEKLPSKTILKKLSKEEIIDCIINNKE